MPVHCKADRQANLCFMKQTLILESVAQSKLPPESTKDQSQRMSQTDLAMEDSGSVAQPGMAASSNADSRTLDKRPEYVAHLSDGSSQGSTSANMSKYEKISVTQIPHKKHCKTYGGGSRDPFTWDWTIDANSSLFRKGYLRRLVAT